MFGARRAIAMRSEAVVALDVGIERSARQGISDNQKRSVCTSSDGSSDIRTYWARMSRVSVTVRLCAGSPGPVGFSMRNCLPLYVDNQRRG